MLVSIERSKLQGQLSRGLAELLPMDSWISAVTAMELRIGALLGESGLRAAARLEFLQNVSEQCPVLPFGEKEAEEAARLFTALRRAGQRIGERDLLIAATAVANGHSVITLNRAEFERVPGLILLDAPDLS